MSSQHSNAQQDAPPVLVSVLTCRAAQQLSLVLWVEIFSLHLGFAELGQWIKGLITIVFSGRRFSATSLSIGSGLGLPCL